MKTYNATNRISAQVKSAIDNTISYHEKYKGSYHWNGTGSASQRRNQEASFLSGNPEYKIQTKQGLIEVIPSLSISCKNYYYSLIVLLDGVKKDVRLLKKLTK